MRLFFKSTRAGNCAVATVLGGFLMAVPLSYAQPVLSLGHADVGIVYADGLWDLHVHDGENNIEYEPSEVVLGVGPASAGVVPGAPAFNFLGSAGSAVYTLPQSQNPNLLFLGLGTEEQALGVFVNNRLRLALEDLTGPGHFALYRVDSFGTPTVLMNSHDGITSGDYVELTAGSHAHANWAFSTFGEYQLTFRGSGVLDDGLNTTVQSDLFVYSFSVVPEPGAASLLALGLGVLLWRQRAINH